MSTNLTTEYHKGILLALCAYLFWGVGPILYSFVEDVPVLDLVFYRTFWLLVFLIVFSFGSQYLSNIKILLSKPKVVLTLAVTAVLLAMDWLIFIWAVNHRQVLDVSLGYFMMPLMTALLGVVVFKEKLGRRQWFAILLAFVGVLNQIWIFGSLPMIALVTALVSSLYPIVRKTINVDIRLGLLLEVMLLLPFILFFAGWQLAHHDFQLLMYSLNLNIAFMLFGLCSAIPLLCFTAAIVRIPVSILGFLQYLSPSLMFLCGLLWLNESFDWSNGIAFGFIWLALIVFSSTLNCTQKKFRSNSDSSF